MSTTRATAPTSPETTRAPRDRRRPSRPHSSEQQSRHRCGEYACGAPIFIPKGRFELKISRRLQKNSDYRDRESDPLRSNFLGSNSTNPTAKDQPGVVVALAANPPRRRRFGGSVEPSTGFGEDFHQSCSAGCGLNAVSRWSAPRAAGAAGAAQWVFGSEGVVECTVPCGCSGGAYRA